MLFVARTVASIIRRTQQQQQRNNNRSLRLRRSFLVFLFCHQHRQRAVVNSFSTSVGYKTYYYWHHSRRINSPRPLCQGVRRQQQQQQQQRLFVGGTAVSNPCKNNDNMTALPSSTQQEDQQVHEERAKIISASQSSLVAAAVRLEHDKELVAFPTETVYGLGCNALSQEAIAKVFAAKERPVTDPLIAHVVDQDAALKLWRCSSSSSTSSSTNTSTTEEHAKQKQQQYQQQQKEKEVAVLKVLMDAFWPGPLTLVAPAAEHVPDLLMAGTGYVAVRCPRHAVARQLIRCAHGTPIAAPSANKFGHVSPTRAIHVWNDLKYENVWIVDGDQTNHDDNDNDYDTDINKHNNMEKTACCNVGVESTVAKLEWSGKENGSDSSSSSFSSSSSSSSSPPPLLFTLTILRQGAISAADCITCLQAAGIKCISSSSNSGEDNRNYYSEKENNVKNGDADAVVVNVVQRTTNEIAENVASVAPGQTVRHYSPNIPSFLLSENCIHSNMKQQQQQSLLLTEEERRILQNAVVLDYGKRLVAWRDLVRAYRDLSPAGNSAEAAQGLFETLRWAEQQNGASRILFPDIPIRGAVENDNNKNNDDDDKPIIIKDDDALILALKDRLTRAASGVVLDNLLDAK